MPAITTNDLKTGITLQLDNGLFQVVEFQHVKPGKGGAFVRTKLRNVRTGNVLDRTFNAGIRVEQAIVERQDMQFLYRDGDDYVFMNTSTYDQLTIPRSNLGDAADYLVEQAVAQIAQYQGQIIGVEIPASVELKVPRPSPACRATASPVPASRRCWRRASRCRCRCSSRPATSVKVDTRTRRVHHPRLMPAPTRPDPRSDARERALYLLYEAQAKGISPIDALELQIVEPDDLTTSLVHGVATHQERLDTLIAAKATDWRLERMPVLDLNVLRLATFELAERPDVPVAVVIDEAVELAKRFSTDNSGRFVNGVLSALAADLRA